MFTVAALAILIAVLFPAAREFWMADNCLDAGGVYDYVGGVCRHDVDKLPATPGPWLRRPGVASITVALVVVAGLLIGFAVRDHSGRPSRLAG
jgi:hypothetical protein